MVVRDSARQAGRRVIVGGTECRCVRGQCGGVEDIYKTSARVTLGPGACLQITLSLSRAGQSAGGSDVLAGGQRLASLGECARLAVSAAANAR